MTQKEYQAAYRASRRNSGRITAAAQRELKKAFTQAGELAAARVAATEAAGLSDLTSAAWRQINNQLIEGARIVSQATLDISPLTISEAYTGYLDADVQYITEAARQAGQVLITDAGIRNIGIGVNLDLLNIQATRTFADGFTFSDRIWNLFDENGLPIGINGDYQYRIKNIILTGQAQGRDSIKIAEDIQLYVAKGRKAVFKPGRYGRLIPGTRQFSKRISRTVDWRALRLVRSELNASLQEAGRLEGVLNPAATNFFDWVKTAGNPIDIDGSRNSSGLRCIDLDHNSPYKEEDVPSYQHANCGCSVVPKLMNQNDFVNDLKTWIPGGEPEYLTEWYRDIYTPAQSNIF